MPLVHVEDFAHTMITRLPFFDTCRRAVMSLTSASLVIGVLVLLGNASIAAAAVVSDSDQPMNFAADTVRVDDKSHLNVLQGNVEISKGSIVVRAERVEVLQGPQGQTATATGGTGGRALFRQRRAGTDEVIEGEAERITYDSRTEKVQFVGRAVMRRLVAGVIADELVGQRIDYDSPSNVFQVNGNKTSSSQGGRVRGIIGPRQSVSPQAEVKP